MNCPYCSSEKLLDKLSGQELETHIQLHADLLRLKDLFLDTPIGVTGWDDSVNQSIVDIKQAQLSDWQEMLS